MASALLPTTMVGSYPRPGWFRYQLQGRDILEAFKVIHHAEAFEDAGNSLRAAGHWREAGHPDRAAVHFSSAARRAAEALAFDRAGLVSVWRRTGSR